MVPVAPFSVCKYSWGFGSCLGERIILKNMLTYIYTYLIGSSQGVSADSPGTIPHPSLYAVGLPPSPQHNPLRFPDSTEPPVGQVKGSPGHFSPFSLCSFLFFLAPPPAAATLKSSPPFPSFLLSFHGLLHYLVLVDSLPALFKLALGLGQVREPPPLPPFVIVSRPRANAFLLCKNCTIPSSHNGYLCVQNHST